MPHSQGEHFRVAGPPRLLALGAASGPGKSADGNPEGVMLRRWKPSWLSAREEALLSCLVKCNSSIRGEASFQSRILRLLGVLHLEVAAKRASPQLAAHSSPPRPASHTGQREHGPHTHASITPTRIRTCRWVLRSAQEHRPKMESTLGPGRGPLWAIPRQDCTS